MAALTSQFLPGCQHLCTRHSTSVSSCSLPSPNVLTLRPARQSCVTVENRVVLRFQRFGRKKRPFFRLVAIDSRSPRDGRQLERLGWYDPLTKATNLNAPSIRKWLDVGGKPSETVYNLLKKAMIIEV
ncbi:hypothetical protein WJX73_002866 [Symbiochloris irregularis]|uniref:30S ribosomal protein S16, chloroplastic n=1 Tax=Symbiochloris irregularis TaxID=706552 RepID=A0AAW1P7R8_9CHLO